MPAKRNLERFPSDFMFQLTEDESAILRSQFATLKRGRGQHASIFLMSLPSTGRSWLR
ncbi:MAG: ORF6N domain-containing protein [Noviherbaspirillum sp.]